MLIERSAACFWTGIWGPERLGSAIATLGIVRMDLENGTVSKEQCQEWHVRPNANVRGRGGKRGPYSARFR